MLGVTCEKVLESAARLAMAILVGLAAWSIYSYTQDEADPPPQVVASPTTTTTEAEPRSRTLADQTVVINLDELEECNLPGRTVPDVNLPAWAHAARMISGRWLVAQGAIALPSIDPERPRLSILWHLETPPGDTTDFTATATTPSGEEVEAIELERTAPGFFRSTFPLNEDGCWFVAAEWGGNKTHLRFFTSPYSPH